MLFAAAPALIYHRVCLMANSLWLIRAEPSVWCCLQPASLRMGKCSVQLAADGAGRALPACGAQSKMLGRAGLEPRDRRVTHVWSLRLMREESSAHEEFTLFLPASSVPRRPRGRSPRELSATRTPRGWFPGEVYTRPRRTREEGRRRR